MFAIPLVARDEKPPWSLRIAAASGFSMTLLYVVLLVFRLINVKNAASFTAKVSGAVAGLNAAVAWYRILAHRIGGKKHVALLSALALLKWSDGAWTGFRGLDQVPCRKVVR